ncbi:MAG: tRNA lysidine(34) synthetase TilS [Candidatus Dormiibacterota bacterium]
MPSLLTTPADLPRRLRSPPARSLAGAEPPAWDRGRPILVALSGGPDSTALLLWLLAERVAVAAAHFDHRLRPESPAEAELVERLCAGLGVPLAVGHRTKPMPRSGSQEAAARALRHQFLRQAAARFGASRIAIAHTADDVVEGVLLHLLRGSALPGLRGMPPERGPIVRPLRHTWRVEVERYLAALGVEPSRDPTNDDPGHGARARARHSLLPAIERSRPGIRERLRRVADRAVRWTDELEGRARACGGDRARLLGEPAAVRFEAYRQLHGGLPALGRRQLEAIDRLVVGGRTGTGLDLPGGRLWVDRDAVRLLPAAHEPSPMPQVAVHDCPGCACPLSEGVHLAPELDPTELRVARRRPGLRLRRAAGAGTRKLQDLLVDAHVPRRDRDRLPLLLLGPEGPEQVLVWVPGVARDRALTVSPALPGRHVGLC